MIGRSTARDRRRCIGDDLRPRVVAPGAYFQFPIAKYGPALGQLERSAAFPLAGYGRARGMLLAAEKRDAQTALMTAWLTGSGTCRRAGKRPRRDLAAASAAVLRECFNDDGAYEEQGATHKELSIRPSSART